MWFCMVLSKQYTIETLFLVTNYTSLVYTLQRVYKKISNNPKKMEWWGIINAVAVFKCLSLYGQISYSCNEKLLNLNKTSLKMRFDIEAERPDNEGWEAKKS